MSNWCYEVFTEYICCVVWKCTVCLQYTVVEDLVTPDGPWQVKATLIGTADQKGKLRGSVTVDVVKGIATFDTLAISHTGTYDIMFQVVRPETVSITVNVSEVVVVKRKITVEMSPLNAVVHIPFSLSVTVKDVSGWKTITNLDWQVSWQIFVKTVQKISGWNLSVYCKSMNSLKQNEHIFLNSLY